MTNIEIEQIWFNGNIETLDQKKPFASAIATSNGKIVAIGSDKEILHLRGRIQNYLILKINM